MLGFEYATSFQLQIRSKATAVRTIDIRGITKDGPFIFKHITTADSGTKTENFSLTDLPIFVSVLDPVGLLGAGGGYITLNLVINGNALYNLVAGYTGFNTVLSWPPAAYEPQTIPSGRQIPLVGADPAAGAEISVTNDAEEQWVILGISFTLVTDATVANRMVHLVFKEGSFVYAECIAGLAQGASLTRKYTCYPTTPGGTLAEDNDIIIPIPRRIKMMDTNDIITETTNLQAGDNFGAPTLLFERYFNPSF